jgi:hypothetical protein
MDNLSVALLLDINELARRYELTPCDFVAVVSTTEKHECVLRFEAPPLSKDKQDRFAAMLSSLGVTETSLSLAGPETAIWSALQLSLRKAPTPLSERRLR